jgi:hypothetical protein
MDEPTIACSLSARDYRERLSSIRKLGEVAFLGMAARLDGADLSFRNSEEVQAELISIIDAEAVCCSFLDLSVHPDGERLILAISAPPDAMPVVRDLTASFQGEQTTG